MSQTQEIEYVASLTRPPLIPEAPPVEVAPGVHVLRDGHIPLVPNVGVLVGRDAALIIDTGVGSRNGGNVLAQARALTDRRLILTVTHFHPEHGWGAQPFSGNADILYNRTQLDELHAKFDAFKTMFGSLGPAVATELEGVELVEPDDTYEGTKTLDLGSEHQVELAERPAHTRGDQIVWLPNQRVLFTGDLVENRLFPIFPDPDAHGDRWIEVLIDLERLRPDVVVPGHGDIGGVEIITATREYLEAVRARVAYASEHGASLPQAQEQLNPEIRELWRDWDAPIWIDGAIERFYEEARLQAVVS
jgi:glyoxylase-like metal-dependent hydrolase (beta-lactamase superfamily II)